jgi:hypothetical protein
MPTITYRTSNPPVRSVLRVFYLGLIEYGLIRA